MAKAIINLLDTNVLVRFFVGDNKSQQEKAILWFKEAEQGKRKIVICPLVITETTFVLESFYRKTRDEIVDVLKVFLSQRWLQIEERDILLGFLLWYKKGFHFVDSFLITKSQISKNFVLSFDKKINSCR